MSSFFCLSPTMLGTFSSIVGAQYIFLMNYTECSDYECKLKNKAKSNSGFLTASL